jgi:hypothetical protein
MPFLSASLAHALCSGVAAEAALGANASVEAIKIATWSSLIIGRHRVGRESKRASQQSLSDCVLLRLIQSCNQVR